MEPQPVFEYPQALTPFLATALATSSAAFAMRSHSMCINPMSPATIATLSHSMSVCDGWNSNSSRSGRSRHECR